MAKRKMIASAIDHPGLFSPYGDAFAMRDRASAWAFGAGLLSAALLGEISGASAQSAASPFGFTIRVSLSPKAREKLTTISESVTVRSFYYGKSAKAPTRAEIKRALANGEEPGQIEILGDTVTLPAAGGIAEMSGRTVSAKDAAAYGRNPINVNINVFSARRAAPDNLLDCSLFDDAVSVARTQPIVVTCRLIGET
jgi:hypothetical protein